MCPGGIQKFSHELARVIDAEGKSDTGDSGEFDHRKAAGDVPNKAAKSCAIAKISNNLPGIIDAVSLGTRGVGKINRSEIATGVPNKPMGSVNIVKGAYNVTSIIDS